MRKVNLKRVLEALTTGNSSPGGSNSSASAVAGNSSGGRKDPDFGENLTVDQFQPCKIVRHGFPNKPSALAYDPVQKLLAIGSLTGAIRILGQPGVDCHVTHDTESPVIQLLFLANQGALVSVCADDTIHLWNLRQKKPAILHSLKFNRERITCCHIPHHSSWIYIGTERGNTHLCNVESFSLSGYSISWNKAIELSQKTHPGHVVSICENPIDENKVLITFESGFIVLWDLKNRAPEQRYYSNSGIRHTCWHFEGKQFMCCHENGSLTLWNSRSNAKPQQEQFPHAKNHGDLCHPIEKVAWLSCRNSDAFIVFSGGLSRDLSTSPRPSVTVMRGRSITVLEMDFPVVDFIALTNTPWKCDFQDPTSLVILLDKELVVVDLEAPGYPCIELSHAMDIHDSPVTCLKYIPDPYTDLIPGLYQVAASKPRRVESSKKEWPITGGEWSVDDCDGIPEIIVTGHADGSVRFWDASAVSLKALYKLRTYKIFKRDIDECENDEEDPFRITHIALCPESRTLATTNVSSTVSLYKLNTHELQSEISCLCINHVNENFTSMESLAENGAGMSVPLNSIHGESKEDATLQAAEPDTNKMANSYPDAAIHHDTITKQESDGSNNGCRQPTPLLRVKGGLLRQSAGFHAEFVCLLLGNEIDPPSNVTYLAINTSYQLLSFGTSSSLCVIDMVQKTCLLNMSTEGMLMSIDKRIQPKSPNKPKPGINEIAQNSFSFDQATMKSPTDETGNVSVNVKTTPDGKVKLGMTSRKSRLTRKSIGDYFSRPHSPISFRRSSLFPKSPSSANPPPLLSHFSQPRIDTLSSTNSSLLLSPDEDETSPDSADVGDAFLPEIPNAARVRFLVGDDNDDGGIKKDGADEKFSLKSESCNGQSHPPQSFHHLSTNQKSMQRELSTSSTGSSCPPGQRIKKPQHRIYKKTGSFSFEKSLDSTTSADESAFSRASSFSDVDRSFPREIVTFLTFACTYTRKSDSLSLPCLWVGTSSGYIFNLVINLPPKYDQRSSQPVMVSPSGALLQMKGSIISCSFLNSSGQLISAGAGNWRDQPSVGDGGGNVTPRGESPDTGKERIHQSMIDKQFMIVCSEKQAKVFTLPSQACIHAINFAPDIGYVVQCNVDTILHGACLACYSSNGNILVYGLPSLNLLLDTAYLPANDVRISQTFCFALDGQAIYLASPSEIQRMTYSVETYESMQEVIGHLFIPCESPDRPNPGFFKGLFGGGHSAIDRKELFGEAQSGRASRGVAKHIPGTGGSSLEGLRTTSTGLASDMQRLRMQAQERGEKLSELDEKTQRMHDSASKFSSEAHALMLKYKNKKWYQM